MVKQLSIFAAVFVFAVHAAASQLIGYGDVVNGEINADQTEQLYSFEGTIGETIVITMAGIPNEEGIKVDSYMELLEPSGEVVRTDDDSGMALDSIIGPIELSENGIYTVVATRCCSRHIESGSTGAYTLTINTVDGTPSLQTGVSTSLTLREDGTPLLVRLTSPEPGPHLMQINRTSGDANFGAVVKAAVDGQYVTGASVYDQDQVQLDPLRLDAQAAYWLILRRLPNDPAFSAEGDVTLDVSLNVVNAQALTIGQAVSDVLNVGEPARYYRFQVGQTDLLKLETSQIGDTPFELIVYSPNAMQTMYVSTEYAPEFQQDPMMMASVGEYMLVVRRGQSQLEQFADVDVPFAFTISQSETPIVTLGVPMVGTVGGMDTPEQIYQFNAQAGQQINVRLVSRSEKYAPAMTLEGRRADTVYTVANVNSNSAKTTFTFEGEIGYDGVFVVRLYNGYYEPYQTSMPEGEFELTITLE